MFKRNPLLIVHLNSETGIPPIPVFEKRFTVGRKPTHLVSIPDNSISRDHIEVIFQDGQLYIMDMGTSNGTAIGGQYISSNVPTPYLQGKIITLGKSNVHLAVEIYEDDREKRKNNPSMKAIQQFSPAHSSNASHASNLSQAAQASHSTTPMTHTAHTASAHAAHTPHPSAPPAQATIASPVQTAASPSPSAAPSPTSPPSAQSTNAAQPLVHNSNSTLSHLNKPVSNSPDFAGNEANNSFQTREDANRILAKAKIEAEIAAKELLRGKEGEAQVILSQAEAKAMERAKETELRCQTLIQAANIEAQKIKEEKLEEIKREKNHILGQVQIEKETLIKDIDALKKTIPALSNQIDQLKIQTQKYQSDKSIAETIFSQEQIKLEKLQAEIKKYDAQLQTQQKELDLNNNKLQEVLSQHNKTIQATNNLIEETKLAHEKAKAKELELQALVETTKNERENAIKFALEQRSDAESYSKVMREEADLYAKNIRENTSLWEKNIRESTEIEINNKYEQLKVENDKIINEREIKYHETRSNQEAILEELRSTEALKLKNLQDIDSILMQREADFEATFESKRTSIESDFKERQKRIDEQLKMQKESIEKELTERRTNIERELLERREILERESAEAKSRIENESQELRTLRDKEYKELKMQQDAYLFDIKKREEDRLRGMIDESKRIMREKYDLKNESIQKNFEDFFKDYTSMASSALKEVIPDLQSKLKEILKESLLSENIGEDKQLKQLFEYDPTLEKKHKKFWIYTASVSAAILIIIGIVIINPNSITKSADTITEIVHDIDQEAKKVHTQRMEQIRKASIYSPTKDEKFKSSYTDNILYTNHYLEFERDEQYRNQWIVSIKEYLIQEVKLIDDTADEILSKEGSLIIALSSETIDGLKPDKGINRMSEKEAEFNQFLSKYLNPDRRKVLSEKKQAFYEQFINDPLKARAPATNQ